MAPNHVATNSLGKCMLQFIKNFHGKMRSMPLDSLAAANMHTYSACAPITSQYGSFCTYLFCQHQQSLKSRVGLGILPNTFFVISSQTHNPYSRVHMDIHTWACGRVPHKDWSGSPCGWVQKGGNLWGDVVGNHRLRNATRTIKSYQLCWET